MTRPTQRFRPELAPLEGRALLSIVAAPHVRVEVAPIGPMVPLRGTITGKFVGNLSLGQAQVNGSGTLRGIGPVKLSGTLSLGASQTSGQGTLLLKGRKGTITVAVSGSLDGLSLAQATVPYQIVSGTGAYLGDTGSGTVTGTLKSVAALSGTFTGKFRANP